MVKPDYISYKIADQGWEFDQIHSLNYRTFVEEIPQHGQNDSRRLIDKFHDQNNYIIGTHEGRVVAMVAIRDERPFSLDSKLPELDKYLPVFDSIVEIRLLAIEKEFRKGKVCSNLMKYLFNECMNRGYDLAIISGTTRELKLYQTLGFKPFADVVGSGEALYQPMYVDKNTFRQAGKFEKMFKSQDAD